MQGYSEESIRAIFKEDFSKPFPMPLPPPFPLSNRLHAPKRRPNLNSQEERLAVKNALRYFPESLHSELAAQFIHQLREYGHIYMYRLRPRYPLKAYPYDWYPTKTPQAGCLIHNIMNNLDPDVAQYSQELITYGGNGSVFSNWAQYHLTLHYLSKLTEEQTLVLVSGHPQGLFPSTPKDPRVTITNGMMVPNYSTKAMYETLYALGNTQYGQMTAGSFCYIGSQGIVHGTTLTLLNAARKYLGKDTMKGVVFVTSGLGGMSGAQPKAGDICGCISVTAEVIETALDKRIKQGWVKEKITDLEELVVRIKEAKANCEATSIAYLGNIVDVWERLALQQHLVDLGSDQTSLHNPYAGGYYPVGLSVEEAQKMMVEQPNHFQTLVHQSLVRQVTAINKLSAKGMKFWDYGNSFLLMASKAGADIVGSGSTQNRFKYPSYVEDIMGDIFQLGFGPFRWICASGQSSDLRKTDKIAEGVISKLMDNCPALLKPQYSDNLEWIKRAEENKLVVGSQARILYADAVARSLVMQAFSEAVERGDLKGPVTLSRDHHDVSGADSPYRQTASVRDGSMFCADMSVQNFVGTALRGATWVALHNGGGTGWGEVLNGGFGVVLTGTKGQREKLRDFMLWDVSNGVSRRSWAGGSNAQQYSRYLMEKFPGLQVTLPSWASQQILDKALSKS